MGLDSTGVENISAQVVNLCHVDALTISGHLSVTVAEYALSHTFRFFVQVSEPRKTPKIVQIWKNEKEVFHYHGQDTDQLKQGPAFLAAIVVSSINRYVWQKKSTGSTCTSFLDRGTLRELLELLFDEETCS